MEKATKAIRRSGTKLRGLSSRHSNLQVLIGQLGDARSSYKNYIGTQQTAADDLVRWTNDSDNRAIQDTCAYLAELSLLWTEVQKEFSERLREYRTQFELILEGERHVDQSRELYCVREQREIKCRKELVKCTTKGAVEEGKLMEERVIQAEKGKDLAYLEVVDRIKENEAVKLIRFREGLRKLSTAYVTLGEKCQAVFGAYHAVANSLPDAQNTDLQQVVYNGSREAAQHVQRAKEQVLTGSLTNLSRASSVDPCSKQALHVNLPDQEPPQLPPKKGGKHEEAAASSSAGASQSSGGASGGNSTARYDPPPSYSSVVREDEGTNADAASVGGACGFTARPHHSNDSTSSSGAIQISYPAYLNPLPHAGTQSSVTERATAPAGAPGESGASASTTADQSRVLTRSVSDRRMVTENRNLMHPVLRKHESSASIRPYSHCSDYSDLQLSDAQLASIRTEKPNKRLSLKSLSFAGKNTISEFLGLNGNGNARMQKIKSVDSEYESYDFPQPKMGETTGSIRGSPDFSSIHGVLPEELPKKYASNGNESTSRTSSSNSNTKKKHGHSNDKSRALSAKFALSVPTVGECREELSPPASHSSASLNSASIVDPQPDRNSVPCSSRTVRQPTKDKRTNDNLSKSAPPEAQESPHIFNDLQKVDLTIENNNPSVVKEEANIIEDLIDLNVSQHDNGNLPDKINGRNKTNGQSSNDFIDSLIVEEIFHSASPSVENSPLNERHELDGNLSDLAKPRAGRKNTNPFHDCANSDESESDTSNSASMTR